MYLSLRNVGQPVPEIYELTARQPDLIISSTLPEKCVNKVRHQQPGEGPGMKGTFDLSGKVAIVTGGGGVLCGCIARALSGHGASLAAPDLIEKQAQKVIDVCQEVTEK